LDVCQRILAERGLEMPEHLILEANVVVNSNWQ
jgi:hypothetical protein